MSSLSRFATIALLCLVFGLGPARAQSLEEAKASGLVGERIDGYVGLVVANPPADIQSMVDQINEERRAKYAEIADQRGVPVDAVAQIAGEKLIERAGPGEFVAGADGRWRQK
jgi:uncharacterized protein YdbL (DUF1318 family)